MKSEKMPSKSEMLVLIGIVTLSGSSPLRQEINAIPIAAPQTKRVSIITAIKQTAKK